MVVCFDLTDVGLCWKAFGMAFDSEAQFASRLVEKDMIAPGF